MREKTIEEKFKERAKKEGYLAWKFISIGNDGVPDRIVLMPGARVYFVEVKAPGKELRPLQRKRKRELERLGFKVFVLDAIEKIDEIIEEIKGG